MSDTVMTLGELSDGDALKARLAESGLDGKAEVFAGLAGSLCGKGLSSGSKVRAYFVPGRIEVLGKHTDYVGGRTLITTIDRGICLVAAERDDNQLILHSDNMSAEGDVAFGIGSELEGREGHWSNYALIVARRLAHNFGDGLRGANIALSGDLPMAAGLSSSSVLITAIYLALADINRLAERDGYKADIASVEDLAGYLGTVENGQSFGELAGDKGVGTFGGSEDHTAILCCKPGKLSLYGYCPVNWEREIEMPAGYAWGVATSGVKAEKTGQAKEKYNRISRLATVAAEMWRKTTGFDDVNLAAAFRDSAEADLIRDVLREVKGGEFSGEELVGRFAHFVAESEEIIPEAADALACGDMETFGRLVDMSQALAETLLGNQVPETIFLARTARELGASAASAFGAGFGGSVWIVAREDEIEGLMGGITGQVCKTVCRVGGAGGVF